MEVVQAGSIKLRRSKSDLLGIYIYCDKLRRAATDVSRATAPVINVTCGE